MEALINHRPFQVVSSLGVGCTDAAGVIPVFKATGCKTPGRGHKASTASDNTRVDTRLRPKLGRVPSVCSASPLVWQPCVNRALTAIQRRVCDISALT